MNMLSAASVSALVAILSSSFPSRAQDGAADLSAIQGRWRLETVNDKFDKQLKASFFHVDGSIIKGFDGCNNFGGSLLRPGLILKSERHCPTLIADFPLDIGNPLKQLALAEVAADTLSIPLTNGLGVARFRRE